MLPATVEKKEPIGEGREGPVGEESTNKIVLYRNYCNTYPYILRQWIAHLCIIVFCFVLLCCASTELDWCSFDDAAV